MRGLGTIILVFGAVAVTFAVYWFRRAASATTDAAAIYKQTGNFGDTARILYRQQSLPDGIRLSVPQMKYVDENFNSFISSHAAVIQDGTHALAVEHVARLRQQGKSPSVEEIMEITNQAEAIVARKYARIWCESRGVN